MTEKIAAHQFERNPLWPNQPGRKDRRHHKMKTRRGYLPAGPHRSRHHCFQYIRGKQLCRELEQLCKSRLRYFKGGSAMSHDK
jgi:hypothetical protein